jgi:hypothetical protein
LKVWSQGLGATELEFRLVNPRQESDSLVIEGITERPVVWKLKVTVFPQDIPMLMNIALNRNMLSFIFKHLRKRILKFKKVK